MVEAGHAVDVLGRQASSSALRTASHTSDSVLRPEFDEYAVAPTPTMQYLSLFDPMGLQVLEVDVVLPGRPSRAPDGGTRDQNPSSLRIFSRWAGAPVGGDL